MNCQSPKLNVKTVLIDVDRTIADPKREKKLIENDLGLDKHPHPLVTLTAKNNHIKVNDAEQRVAKAEASVKHMTGQYRPFGILDQLGITKDELWDELIRRAKSSLFIYPDAISLLKFLKTITDIRVYPATTNHRLLILSKLAICGLADRNGSAYLDGCFGGEEIIAGGKCSPDFFLALLQRTNSKPDTTLMIGDHPEEDLKNAKQAGIDQVILPRRNQSEEWIYESDGGIYVKSLKTVEKWLAK